MESSIKTEGTELNSKSLHRDDIIAIKAGLPVLSIIVVEDDAQYSAFCPQLDLAIAMDTPEEAVKEMISEIKEYADEYIEFYQEYSVSPNRAEHAPLVKKIISCESDWALMTMIEIKYGDVHLQTIS